VRVARGVGADRALAWYREAMRLWRRGPATFAVLALLVLCTELALTLVPVAGVALTQLALPLVACGMLYASLAADRGDQPRVAHAIAVFAAPLRAWVAVVASGLVVFAAEAVAAYLLAGVDMLQPLAAETTLSATQLLAVYVVGVAVSLPVTFVPFSVLFDGTGTADAFAESWHAFARNPVPMLLYGVLSLALLAFGWATYGVGLLLALPWWAASSYAAWKDVFDVRGAAAVPPLPPPG
jgi:uncharacterized membrane protein